MKETDVLMERLYIYIVSDSVGETGEMVARAAISQFETDNWELRRFPHMDDVKKIEKIIVEAASLNSVIFYTLVTKSLRIAMKHYAGDYNVAIVDVLGSPLRVIENAINADPTREVGGLRKLDNRYFNRVEAMEFAVQYDDGKDIQGFKDADIVILGVSRTSKTPVCMYLAHKGIKAANWPIVPEVPVPPILFELPRRKVFGLTIDPNDLNEIRTQRLLTMGAAETESDYANPIRLQEELAYAKLLYRRIGCRVLDVTNKAIEETAGNILEIYFKNKDCKEALHE